MEKTIEILVLSDLHHWTYKELLKIKELNYDICILCGDITEDAVKCIVQLAKGHEVLAVPGNHDDWDTPEAGGAENIHMKIREACGLSFAGFGGSVRYKYGEYCMFTQKECIKLISKLDKADILISHDSMYHMFGRDKPHEGLMGIDFYNLKNRVRLNICGHHHTSAVKKRFGTTTVCVFRCAVIAYPDMIVKKIF